MMDMLTNHGLKDAISCGLSVSWPENYVLHFVLLCNFCSLPPLSLYSPILFSSLFFLCFFSLNGCMFSWMFTSPWQFSSLLYQNRPHWKHLFCIYLLGLFQFDKVGPLSNCVCFRYSRSPSPDRRRSISRSRGRSRSRSRTPIPRSRSRSGSHGRYDACSDIIKYSWFCASNKIIWYVD